MVTGASGQIGSELIPALRDKYGSDNVIASVHESHLLDEVELTGPSVTLDVTDKKQIEDIVSTTQPDTIFHLASVLSALAEEDRQLAYKVNFEALYTILETSVKYGVEKVIIPSSI